MSVLVFIDTRGEKIAKAELQALGYGKHVAEKAGSTVTAVTFGDGKQLEDLGQFGAKKVVVARGQKNVDGQQLTKLVCDVAKSEGAQVIICVHDNTGKAVAPRVAARLKAGHVAGAITLPDTGSGFRVKRNVFSGKAQAWVEVKSPVKVISLMPNSVAIEKGEGSAEVTEFTGDLGPSHITVKEFRKAGEGIALPEADIVVSAGRGLKGPENWGMVEELAKELRAATACSRPVADSHWRPHQHRHRHQRRHPAPGRREREQGDRRDQQGPGGALLQGRRLRHRGRCLRSAAQADRSGEEAQRGALTSSVVPAAFVVRMRMA
jgi:electron transfer flavoprotein alpha subunit